MPERVRDHPAGRIEAIASRDDLDTAELYSECILAIQERDAAPDASQARELATA